MEYEETGFDMNEPCFECHCVPCQCEDDADLYPDYTYDEDFRP